MENRLDNLARAAQEFAQGQSSMNDLVAVLRALLPLDASELTQAQAVFNSLHNARHVTEQQHTVLLRLCAWDPNSSDSITTTADALADNEHGSESVQQGMDQEEQDPEEEDDATVFVTPASKSNGPQEDDADNDATVFVGAAPTDSSASDTPASENDEEDEDGTVFVQPPSARVDTTPPPEHATGGRGSSDVSQSGPLNTGTQQTSGTGTFGTTSGASSWSRLSKAEADTPVEIGGVVADRFVLEDLLGKGGMGIVYKARDLLWEEAQDRNPYVAIKILNDEFRRHPESLKALQREARKSQTLAHPNIVHVYNFDRDGTNVYMTMEFLDGEPLDQILKKRSTPFPVETALTYIRQMGEALDYAHRHNIVHSDFKPGNVFLTKSEAIKVLDFGIAQATKAQEYGDGETTHFNAKDLGALTPAYASLEMFLGDEPEPNDDIYALGCVAYELLANKHPYSKKPANKVVLDPPELTPIPGLKRRQWQALQSALALHRKDRTDNIEEFLAGLIGEPSDQKRYRLALMGAAAILVIGVSTFGTISYLNSQKLSDLTSDLTSAEAERVESGLLDLEELTPEERGAILTSVSDRLTQFFVTASTESFDPDFNRYDYATAESLIGQGLALYSDSNRLINAQSDIEQKRNQLLNELDARFTSALSADRLLPQDGPDSVEVVLNIVRQVDSDNPMLTDPQLAYAYREASDSAIEREDFEHARNLLSFAVSLFPEDSGLASQLTSVAAQETRLAMQEEITNLELTLANAVTGISSIDELPELRTPLLELTQLDPNNLTLTSAHDVVYDLVSETVQSHVERFEWTQAFDQVRKFQDLLDPNSRQTLQGDIETANSSWQSRIDVLVAEISDTAGSDLLADADNPALVNLQQLRDIKATDAQIDRAQAIIAQGYLDMSRTRRAQSDWDGAENLLRGGLANLDQSHQTRLSRELSIVATSKLAANEQEQRQRIEQERAERIAELETTLNTQLASIDTSSVRNVLNTIDEIEAIDPASQIVAAGQQQLIESVRVRVGELRRTTQFQEADRFLREAELALPATQALSEERNLLNEAISANERREQNAQIAQLTTQLETLLGSRSLDQSFESRFESSLSQLESRGALTPAEKQQFRERAAQRFLDSVDAEIAANQLATARQTISRGRQYAPDLSQWGQQLERISSAQALEQERAANAQTLARLSSLKRTFNTQINALDTDRASSTLVQIAAVDSSDDFSTGEGAQLLADAFLQRARRSIDFSDYTSAVTFLNQGAQYGSNTSQFDALRDVVGFEQAAQQVREHFQNGSSTTPSYLSQAVSDLQAFENEYNSGKLSQLTSEIADIIRSFSASDQNLAETLQRGAQRLFPTDATLRDLDVVAENQSREQSIIAQAQNELLDQALRAKRNGQIFGSSDSAVEILKSVLRDYPNNVAANNELNALTQTYIQRANQQLNAAQVDEVVNTIQVLEAIGRSAQQVSSLRAQRSEVQASLAEQQRRQEFDDYVQAALASISDGPASRTTLDNAAAEYQRARNLYPRDEDLVQLALRMDQEYNTLARTLVDDAKFDDATKIVEDGLAFNDNNRELNAIRSEIASLKKKTKKKRRVIGTF